MKYSWLPIVALLAGSAMAQVPPTAPLPLEHFTRFDEFGTIKISPDGEFLAMSAGKYGQSAIVFIDIKQNKLVSGVRAPDDMAIGDFEWVSATRVIYSKAERFRGRVRPGITGEIFAVDRDGTKARHLYGYNAGQQQLGTKLRVREASYATPELITPLKSDDRRVLIAEYPWTPVGGYMVFNRDAKPKYTLLDVYTGMKDELGAAPLSAAVLLVDGNEQVRFALGYNTESKLAVSWKPTAGSSWSDFVLPGFDNETVEPRRFSSDNGSVLFTGVREGEQYAALYKLNLQTRAIDRIRGFDGADVDDVIMDFADQEIVGIRGYTDGAIYEWIDARDPAAMLREGLKRAFPKQSVSVTSTTQDGRLAIVFVSSDTNPGEYYLFNTEKKTADFLRAARAWIDPAAMQHKEPIELTARDGLKLHGYLTRAKGEGPHPLIVLPHGGPHGVRDDWSFEDEVQLFASRGYSVLQINFRGSGGYGEKFEAAGFREWGGRMQDDVTDATRWAIEQKVAAADRICIYGASYGGFAALTGVFREPDLYRCAIGYAGVYDLELMLSISDIPNSRSGRAYLQKALGDDREQLRSRSPVYHAAEIKAPVFLIHGKSDGRADIEHAERMRKALQKEGKSVEWLALTGEGHGIYDEDSRKAIYERMLAFLDRHLQPTSVVAR